MAATRSKNTPGNYKMEQESINKIRDELLYVNQSQGQAIQTYHPGDGLLSGKVAPQNLSGNPCDIESFLFGIGSTNLVEPLPPLKAEIKTIPSLNVAAKTPMILPNGLGIEPNQRPMYLN